MNYSFSEIRIEFPGHGPEDGYLWADVIICRKGDNPDHTAGVKIPVLVPEDRSLSLGALESAAADAAKEAPLHTSFPRRIPPPARSAFCSFFRTLSRSEMGFQSARFKDDYILELADESPIFGHDRPSLSQNRDGSRVCIAS